MDDSFYITGGTLPLGAGSYVTRAADAVLLDGLRHGDFCYVLDTRQMGKSSLMLRTARRLREEGYRVAVLDLTAVGQNLTVEQWYFGLLARVAGQIKQSEELFAFWKSNKELGPMQRFVEAIRAVLLTPKNGETGEVAPLVLFVDEIDAVRSLPFSADEFFGGIRECYNRRAQEAVFERLTFCLLGVAAPTDLVQDTRLSPFNIGRRVELCDFAGDEAALLARGLSLDGANAASRADRLLRRVMYWTNGHPYMTQRLCQATAQSLNDAPTIALRENARVDRLCRDLFLTQEARETDDNLTFVRNRLLHSEADVTALLDFYAGVRRGKTVRDDNTNPLCSLLKLSGAVAQRRGKLTLRNRVYSAVFDAAWVRSHLPGAEVRRQQTAYRAGVRRTALAGGAVLVCVGALATVALRQTGVARRAEKEANEQKNLLRAQLSHGYVEDAVRFMDAGDYGAALAPLAAVISLDRDNAARLALHRERFASVTAFAPRVERFWSVSKPVRWATYSPDKRFVAAASEDGQAQVWDAVTGAALPLPPQRNEGAVTFAAFSPDGTRLVTCGVSERAHVWQIIPQCRLLYTIPAPRSGADSQRGTHAAWSRDGRRIALARGEQVSIWEVGSGAASSPSVAPRLIMRDESVAARFNEVAFSPDGASLTMLFENFQGWYVALPSNKSLFAIGSRALGGCYVGEHSAWSRDGRRLLIAGSFGARANNAGAVVFDTEHSDQIKGRAVGKTLLPLLRHTQPATWSVFSPDEKRIATASADGTARVWDAQTGKPVTPPLVHERPVAQIAFSPSGRRVVTASADGTARIWDAQTGKPFCAPLHHAGAVVTADFSDENHVLTASRDGSVRVWALPSPAPLIRLTGGWDYKLLPGGKCLIATRGGVPIGKMRWYDLETGKRLFPDPVNLSAFSLWSFDRDLRRFILHGNSGAGAMSTEDNLRNVQVWDTETGKAVSPLLHSSWATLSHDGKRILLSEKSGVFRLADTSTGKLVIPPLRGAVGPGFSVDGKGFTLLFAPFTPDDRRLLLCSTETSLRFYDARTGRPDSPPMPHRAPVQFWAFSPDGRYLFTSATNGDIRVWNALDGSPASASMPYGAPLFGNSIAKGLTYSPDNQFALTTGERCAYLWPLNGKSGSQIQPQTLPLPETTRFVFSPDSKSFVALNQTAWLWRVGARTPVMTDAAYTAKVSEVAFSPDSRRALVVREDGTADVWDIQTARPLTPPLIQKNITSAVFSPDGETAATANKEGLVRLWDAATGEPVTPSMSLQRRSQVFNAGNAIQLAFGLDGNCLLAYSREELSVWKSPKMSNDEALMSACAQLLSGQRIDARLGAVPVDNAALRAAWKRVGPLQQGVR